MQNFEICKHGVDKKWIKCPLCQREAEIAALPTDYPKCKHGNPEGYCSKCEEELWQKEKSAREEKVRKEKQEEWEYLQAHPEDKLRDFGIPPKYLNCSFEGFKGNDKLVSECRKDIKQGLFLTGKTGSGKTHLSIAILRELVKKGESVKFKNVSELLLEIRGSFRAGSEITEQQIVEEYSESPATLVLDDLGSEKTSEYAVNTLYIIINCRDQELFPTIITSNLSLAQIETKLSARIASRISGLRTIKINMVDHRKLR